VQLFDKIDFVVFEDLKMHHWTSFQASHHWIKYFKFLWLSEKNVNEDDFSLFRVLGRGGFGLVNGCKKATTGKLYAMKVMNKKRVKVKKSDALCRNERTTLELIDSPFVVCLRYAFHTPQELYLILDLMMGGDLGFHLSRKGRFSKLEAKYYAARTLLGLAALHAQGVVYRDLKPENILMDADGTTKISDLGLATKIGKNGLSDVCGTRGYWAPEMIRRDANGKRGRYTESVDWFSYGCCVYEFIYGISPFRTERARNWRGMDPKREKDKAIDAALVEMEPEYDLFAFDPKDIDFCQKLLCKDGKKRLGAGGADEVMSHPWFDDVNWVIYYTDLS
jgi:beta-adrenergic-receptor kinase